MVDPKDWARPSFRRGYALLWLGILVLLGLAMTHLIPTGEITGCEVTSPVDSVNGGLYRIETSCGSLVSFSVLARHDLEPGVRYDFQMRGVFLRYVETWTLSDDS